MRKTLDHLRRIVLPDSAINGESSSKGSSTANNQQLVDVLLIRSSPTWSKRSGEPIRWLGDRLNDSQKDAIEFCLEADQVACIHGPPGVGLSISFGCPADLQTGKTHTLVELIFQLLSRPSSSSSATPPRVLVTTPSNLALDNILLRLHILAQTAPYSTLLPPGSILRLGHPTRVHRDLVSETLDWRAANGDDGSLVRDVGREIEQHLSDLGKKKGERGSVRGKERGEKWSEVRELRKERVGFRGVIHSAHE
jgi:DNA polymerase alpha-associated DNA helicase A